jgi:hypothetical protein
MPTLRTAATATSTRIDQVLPATPAATPVRKHTPTDKPAKSALCAARKDVSLQDIPRKNVISLERDLITRLTSLF